MSGLLDIVAEVAAEQPSGEPSTALGFGSDLWCELDLDPMMRELDADDPLLVAQNALRLITIERGTYPDDPDVGTNLFAWLRRPTDARFKAALEGAIAAEIRRDERVATLSVTVSPSANLDSASVAINGTCAKGPFRLSLSLSKDGVVLREIAK